MKTLEIQLDEELLKEVEQVAAAQGSDVFLDHRACPSGDAQQRPQSFYCAATDMGSRGDPA